jgi:hypothetical protein
MFALTRMEYITILENVCSNVLEANEYKNCLYKYINSIKYIVAYEYLPYERTAESRKPRNTHSTITLRVFIARC